MVSLAIDSVIARHRPGIAWVKVIGMPVDGLQARRSFTVFGEVVPAVVDPLPARQCPGIRVVKVVPSAIDLLPAGLSPSIIGVEVIDVTVDRLQT